MKTTNNEITEPCRNPSLLRIPSDTKEVKKPLIKIRKLAVTSVLILLWSALLPAIAQEPGMTKILEVYPGDDYRSKYSQLNPGDQLVFHEGTYSGSAGTITTSGTEEKPIIIRGYGNGEKRPILRLNSKSSNLLQVHASNLIFEFLEFQSEYTYGIRIGASGTGNKYKNIIIRDCIFYNNGGGDISANASVEYDSIEILNNYFFGSKKTPVYIGEHAGNAKVTNFVFRGNVVDGSQIFGDDIIGYGIQLKLNVTGGIIENNFITGTKGPGIMVYGATDTDTANANFVRNNIVVGSKTNPGIVVGGGPSEVTGNITFRCNGGISVQNYGGRNLLNNIKLKQNTAVIDLNYGMSFGNMTTIVAGNNSVITSNSSTAYRNNPTPGYNNTIITPSNDLISTVLNELLISMPDTNNLEKIWQFINPGSLNEERILELLELLLEYKILLDGETPVSSIMQAELYEGFRLYPNPASDYVKLAFDRNGFSITEIAVLSSTGKQVYNRKFSATSEMTLNLRNLSRGIYLVKIKSDKKEYCKKLILKLN